MSSRRLDLKAANFSSILGATDRGALLGLLFSGRTLGRGCTQCHYPPLLCPKASLKMGFVLRKCLPLTRSLIKDWHLVIYLLESVNFNSESKGGVQFLINVQNIQLLILRLDKLMIRSDLPFKFFIDIFCGCFCAFQPSCINEIGIM